MYRNSRDKRYVVVGKRVLDNTLVAIKTQFYKFPKKKFNCSEVAEVVLHRRALSLKNISSNIIKLVDNFCCKNSESIVTEFRYEYQSLEKVIEQGRVFSENEIKSIGKKLILILSQFNAQGLYHLDLKPQNLLVTKNSTNFYLIDFGNSQFKDPSKKLKINYIHGTPIFSIPEVLHKQIVDASEADMWGAGIIIYYLAEREIPFKSIAEIKDYSKQVEFRNNSKTSPLGKSFIRKILSKKRKERLSYNEALDHSWLKNYL